MTTLVGVDGCKTGWITASIRADESKPSFAVLESPAAILERFRTRSVIAVDIPIGLTDKGPRTCDQEARRTLGAPRASSVFPAPIRAILGATSREEASRVHEDRDGRGFGVQSWAILPRIRLWDSTLRENPDRIPEVYEVHPEVCFWALNRERSVSASKKTATGRNARRQLLESAFGSEPIDGALRATHLAGVAADDVFDALAALWTAQRIANGAARTIPAIPPVDRFGLPMAMWY
jgi:predicted RNase H-like nuclease